MMISLKCQVHPPQQPSSPLKVNKLVYIFITYANFIISRFRDPATLT